METFGEVRRTRWISLVGRAGSVMGIYDREYFRREGSGYLDTLLPSGQVCKYLILINVGIYVLQLATLGTTHSITEYLILSPKEVLTGQVWRLLTYAFLHDPNLWQHIFFNMLFLWWFGSDLERMYGPAEFLTFYLLAALLGGLAFVAFGLASGGPVYCLGASGAITAVMVLFAFHFPSQTILIFFILPVPIWFFVVFQVAQDAFIFVSGIKTGTAVTVHLAGAGFGALYYKRHWHLLGWWATLRSWKFTRPRTRLRVFRPDLEKEDEPVPVSTSSAHLDLDEHLEAKLDSLLEKVSRSGESSLTDKERQILLKASEIYKRKRT